MEDRKDFANGNPNPLHSFPPPANNQSVPPNLPNGNNNSPGTQKRKVNPLAIVIPVCALLCIALSFGFYQLGFSNSSSHYQEKYEEGYRDGESKGYDTGMEDGYEEGYAAAKTRFLLPASFEQGKVYLNPDASCVAPFKVSTASTDTYIYLDYEDDQRDIGFCVKANTTYERDVPLGTCQLYYATGGDTWYGTEYGLDYCFGENTKWYTSDDTFSFTKDSNYYYGNEIILYRVENGNWDTYTISPSDLPF